MTPPTTDWDPSEPDEVLDTFRAMLQAVTGDGAKKRQSGEKPSWKVDPGHETAIFSHLWKWKNGEMVDPDSGAHPLVHLAWRALAIAYQENGGTVYTHKHHKHTRPTVITTPGPVTAEQASRLKEEWQAIGHGPVVVLSDGASIEDAPSAARTAGAATEAESSTETAPRRPEASWSVPGAGPTTLAGIIEGERTHPRTPPPPRPEPRPSPSKPEMGGGGPSPSLAPPTPEPMTTKAEREAARARRAAAQAKAAARQEALDRAHRRYVWNKYGVDYDALLEAQGGRCAICRGIPRKARLHVDHDHDKERAGVPIAETVRGLLCSRCNHRLLGAAHDDATIVLRAYHYLIDPPAQKIMEKPDDPGRGRRPGV